VVQSHLYPSYLQDSSIKAPDTIDIKRSLSGGSELLLRVINMMIRIQ
jgi:hypothetical protein